MFHDHDRYVADFVPVHCPRDLRLGLTTILLARERMISRRLAIHVANALEAQQATRSDPDKILEVASDMVTNAINERGALSSDSHLEALLDGVAILIGTGNRAPLDDAIGLFATTQPTKSLTTNSHS